MSNGRGVGGRKPKRQSRKAFAAFVPTPIETFAIAPGRGPESDPKGAAGRAKPGFKDISPAALMLEAEALRQGGVKYGYLNWAEERMKASTYFEAMLRHLFLWWLRQETDTDGFLPHPAFIRASAGIVIEQALNGKLIDDRPKVLDEKTWGIAVDMVKEARRRFVAERKAKGLPTGE